MNALKRILELVNNNFPSEAAFERNHNLKPKTVDSWKRNNSKSYLKMLPELAIGFNVSTDYLLGKTEDPTPPDKQKIPTAKSGSAEWLYDGLVSRGVIKAGEDFTDEQLEIILKNMDVLAQQLNEKFGKSK